MKRTSKVLFNTVVVLICIVIIFYSPVTAITHQDIPTGEEFISGTITNQFSNLQLNYVWVNTNETSFLSLTMYDELSGMSPIAPFYPFFGQSFNVNNNPFFVGTVITGFELYQDSNDNGVLDLGEELKYYVGLNASQGILLPQIEKTTTDTKRIYKWKVGYSEIDGFLFPDTDLLINRKAIIDSVNLTYTFEISDNYSELKLAIEMGAWDAYEFTFNDQYEEIRLQNIDLTNYSLSILFGTTVSSEQPVSIDVTNETAGISDAIIKVNDVPIFQSLFQDTYDLGLSGSTYSAKAIPAALDTLYDDQVLSWHSPQDLYNWWDSFFSSMSDLTMIPSLDIENVNFLYRICYPIWNGEPFNHDPRYRALFDGIISPPDSSTSEPSSSSVPVTFPTSTAETTSTNQLTPILLIPEVFVLLILVPFLRKKRNV